MAMRKTGDAEKLEIAFVGEEARVVNDHLRKHGRALSEFTDEEKRALWDELEALEGHSSSKRKAVKEPKENRADPEDGKSV